MRLHRFPILFFLFCFFILNSCEYKLKGDYFRNLNAIPPSNVLITISGHSDTLIATTNESYKVQVSCGDRITLFYRLYIDGVQKHFESVSSNTFYINPVTFTNMDGVYKMTVEAGINTGSGSIGDVLGTEGYLISKEFILVVLNGQGTFYPNQQFDRTNGTLKVILDVPSNIQNVKKVTFSKSVASSPYAVFATVHGTNHYEAIDASYVGESANFSVQTYLGDPAGTIFIPFVNGSTNVSYDLPEITAGVSNRGYPLLSWDKTHYTANCGSYRIYAKPNGSNMIELLGSVSNINDTMFEAAGATFPGNYLFHVAPVPIQVPSYYTDATAWTLFSREVYSVVGLNSFWFDRFLTPNGSFIYYTNSPDVIYEYSAETGTITNEINTSSGWFYTFAVSPNGKYLLAATGASDFSYLFYDLTTKQSTWILSSVVIGAGAHTGIISVADNGLSSVITGNKIVIYDFLHQVPITQQVLPMDADRTVISADGQYIFAEAGYLYLYKFVSGALQQKWSSSGSYGTIKYYTFDPSQPSEAKIFINQTFYTKNCDSWATVNSFALNISDLRNIDFTNGHILGSTTTYFMVFDANTGSLQFQNPTSPNLTTFDLRIKKNTVYHYGGKKLIIF